MEKISLPDFFTLGERLRVHILNGGYRDSSRSMEAARRVDELEWLLVRCRSLEGSAVALDDSTEEAGHQQRMAELELRILVEAFYQSAWRLMTVLDHEDEPVIGISGLKRKCVGIRNVRNKLLEHPEGEDSRVFDQTFSWGGRDGPKLKPIRTSDNTDERALSSGLEFAQHHTHKWVDRGLYVNAAELVDALGSMLPPAHELSSVNNRRFRA